MSATRTQIYLTEAQRRRIDEICRLRGISLAEAVREAVDAWVTTEHVALADVLDSTFGRAAEIEVPDRAEWDRATPQTGVDATAESRHG